MSPRNDAKTETQPYAAWIGLDWADQKHFWSMCTADGKRTQGQLDNTPEAIEVWAAELAQQFGGRPLAVALEQARGAVIGMLSKYAHLVLFPVHPTTLANYRKAFSPSGAKSDPEDGDLILDLLVKHPERLRRLQPDTVETRGLQFLTEERRKLVDQHTSETQRLINWLKQVFPQILRWFDDPAAPLVGDLLLRWPTLQQLQKASSKTLLKFFHEHNCRSEERIKQRLDQIGQAVPAVTDPALLQTGTLCIHNSVGILKHMRNGIASFDRQIAEIYRAHPDRAIVESFPRSQVADNALLQIALYQLDIAHDYARAGFLGEAIELLAGAAATARDLPDQSWGALLARLRLSLQQSLFSSGLGLVTKLNRSLILMIGGFHVLEGHLTVGMLIVILDYVGRIHQPLQEIGETFTDIQLSLASADRILDVLDVEPWEREELRKLGGDEKAYLKFLGIDSFHTAPGFTPTPIVKQVGSPNGLLPRPGLYFAVSNPAKTETGEFLKL